jgi:PadR family transcriptional regulator PadR
MREVKYNHVPASPASPKLRSSEGGPKLRSSEGGNDKRRRDTLGHFELVVLLALMRLNDEAYGLPIFEEIGARMGREVALGSVYAALGRLEDKGYVTSRLGAPTASRGGKAKRYFRVTDEGVREVHGVRRTLVSMWQGLA